MTKHGKRIKFDVNVFSYSPRIRIQTAGPHLMPKILSVKLSPKSVVECRAYASRSHDNEFPGRVRNARPGYATWKLIVKGTGCARTKHKYTVAGFQNGFDHGVQPTDFYPCSDLGLTRLFPIGFLAGPWVFSRLPSAFPNVLPRAPGFPQAFRWFVQAPGFP